MITLCMAMVMFTGRLLLGKAELHLMSPRPGLPLPRNLGEVALGEPESAFACWLWWHPCAQPVGHSYSIEDQHTTLEPTRRPAACLSCLVLPIGVSSARVMFIIG